MLHANYSEEEIKIRITEYMENTFKQAQFNMTDATATVLSSKKGACTCKYKRLAQIKSQRTCHITEPRHISSKRARRWISLLTSVL